MRNNATSAGTTDVSTCRACCVSGSGGRTVLEAKSDRAGMGRSDDETDSAGGTRRERKSISCQPTLCTCRWGTRLSL